MKKHLCKILMAAYHLIFLGGSVTLFDNYLDEIAKLRTEIVRQVDRAEEVVKSAEKSALKINNDIQKTSKDLTGSVSSINKEIGKIKKACNKFPF